jgi:hypothetical protein
VVAKIITADFIANSSPSISSSPDAIRQRGGSVQSNVHSRGSFARSRVSRALDALCAAKRSACGVQSSVELCLHQNVQLPGSAASIRRTTSAGMSCTTMVRASSGLHPDVVHMLTAGIDKPHPLRVDMRRAFAIVAFIGGHRPRSYDEQAVARMRVPAAARSGRKHVALQVHV